MKGKILLLAGAVCGIFPLARGAVVGTNIPAAPLTAARVAGLPAWRAYFENSQRQQQADRDFLDAELRAHALSQATWPDEAYAVRDEALDNPPEWYGGDEALHIAEVLVSFQTPAGGWCMNTDFTQAPRTPGQRFGAQPRARNPLTNDFDFPLNFDWSLAGTFNNGATTTEMRFLAKVAASARGPGDRFRQSFLRGLEFIFSAQYPNGGWPQHWPLQGGYHDAVTLNANAMIHVLDLLQDVAGGQNDFAFVPAAVRARAAASRQHGVDCLLAAQVRVGAQLTIWCQQHDALTLQPASGRNYEMPALAPSESAAVVMFLMRLPQPNSNIVAAVDAACAWFESHSIAGSTYAYVSGGGDVRQLVARPGHDPIWAREYQIGSNKPIFGDRDKTIHDDVSELSKERRNSYAWFRDTPKRALAEYAVWKKSHP
jgi:PelA/Pel-15E family pectate lyase